jgi:tetratricopeptide (TPR) repeat protein
MATAGGDFQNSGEVRVWDVATGEPVAPAFQHDIRLEHVRFTPDGQHLAGVNAVGDVWLLDLSPDTRPVGSLLSLVRLLSAEQLTAGATRMPVEPEAIVRTWQHLRRSLASDAPSPAEVLAWHKEEVVEAMGRGDMRAEVFHLSGFLSARPSDPSARLLRADLNARLGAWPDAAADYDQAIDVGLPASLWDAAALAQLAAGNRAGYRKVCAAALAQAARPQSELPPYLADLPAGVAANNAAWTCALGPDAGDMEAALRQARRAVGERPREAAMLNTLGAVLYRAGQFEAAVRTLAEAEALAGPRGELLDWIFLAMAHQQLGHASEARRWFDRAEHFAEPVLAEPPDSRSALPWPRRLEIQLLLKEAKGVVSAQSASRLR